MLFFFSISLLTRPWAEKSSSLLPVVSETFLLGSIVALSRTYSSCSAESYCSLSRWGGGREGGAWWKQEER